MQMCETTQDCRRPNRVCEGNVCVRRGSVQECEGQTRRCNDAGTAVKQCDNGVYVEIRDCAVEGMVCSQGMCVADLCEEGSKRCAADGNVEFCRNGTFTLYTECSESQECNNVTFECDIRPECQPDGAKRCSGNDVEVCLGGRWMRERRCPDAQACDTGTLDCAPAPQCDAGEKRCNGDDYEECVDGQWEGHACPGVTVCGGDGECRNEGGCVSGEMRCYKNDAQESFVQKCVGGKFSTEQACLPDEVCAVSGAGAACARQGDTCAALYRCDGNALVTCRNGVSETKACASDETCDASQGKCVKKCGNGVIDAGEECDGQTFKPGASCSSVVGSDRTGELSCDAECKIVKTGCVKEEPLCTAGDALCDLSASPTVYKTCSGGKWVSKVCGASQLCDDAKGCYDSGNEPGSSVCEGWAHCQDFESAEKLSGYSETILLHDSLDKNIVYRVTGRTDGNSGFLIGGERTVILTNNKSHKNAIVIEGITKGVKSLTFDYGKGASGDSGEYVVEVGSLESTVSFTTGTKQDKWSDSALDVKGAATVTIYPKSYGSKNSSRIAIDNIRWQNNP